MHARFGGRQAVDGLFPAVYDELRIVARAQLGRLRPGDTLNTTALVHEAYLKLAGRAERSFADRKHFFTVAALAMRQIVVDYARRQMARKRGGGVADASLDALNGAPLQVEAQAASIVAIDDALARLSDVDARLARVVELRFFAGLSVEESAHVLDVSAATIKRDTRAARAFLAREIGEAAP
jgi:RNA polymerase sigma factor (TIGR02999 family)